MRENTASSPGKSSLHRTSIVVRRGGKQLKEFSRGLLTGLGSAGMISVFLLIIWNFSSSSESGLGMITSVWDWLVTNLRLSIIPFGLILVFYFVALQNLGRKLDGPSRAVDQVAQAEYLADIWINCFFGIGVIWTAIGMRSALLSGLSGLDAATAHELGAFTILQRLVEGGILLALSTTIFGAVGGYLMRIYKAMSFGGRLRHFYHHAAMTEHSKMLEYLKQIEINVRKIKTEETSR